MFKLLSIVVFFLQSFDSEIEVLLGEHVPLASPVPTPLNQNHLKILINRNVYNNKRKNKNIAHPSYIFSW